jgi:hypothetical protein
MASKKSQPKNCVEAVFNGSISEAANVKSQPQPAQPVTPAVSTGGFGTPMMVPQPTFPNPQAAGFQSYMSDCCKSLIPGTTIGTYVRCKSAEFVVDNWKLGGLYRIETTDHHCVAFLTKKAPESLEFSSVDDNGKNVVFEIKANDLCCDFQEKTERYPFTRMIQIPTNPIVIYPIG